MELETEKLLKKWLRIQLWQTRIQILVRLAFFFSLIFSLWLTYSRLLPSLENQLNNTQKMMNLLQPKSQFEEKQLDFLENIQQQLEGQLNEVN